MSERTITDISSPVPDDTGTISRTIYRAVSETKEVDPLDLPPLAEAIDGESLEKFLNQSNVEVEFSIEFEYAGCHVRVTETEISVEPNGES